MNNFWKRIEICFRISIKIFLKTVKEIGKCYIIWMLENISSWASSMPQEKLMINYDLSDAMKSSLRWASNHKQVHWPHPK